MNFLNPFDLLELETADSEAIKKAKKLKLADIELNDGFLEWGHQKISKSDFIKLIDDLDDKRKRTSYFYIKKNKILNDFLIYSDINFFYLYRDYDLYRVKYFIDFVSPYFADSFNKVLVQKFKEKDSKAIIKLFSVPLLVNHKYTDKLYINLSRLLNDDLEKLQNINPNDKNINNIENNCKSIANVELLNTLPDYFQNQRNDFAMELRNISVRVYNYGYSQVSGKAIYYQISYNIVYHAQLIKIDSLTKIKVKKELDEINALNEKEKLEELNKPILEKWRKVFLAINSITEDVENNNIETNNVITKIQSIFSINELNYLSKQFIEIHNQIAFILRGLSVAVWNETNDADVAINVLVLAQRIQTDTETRSAINADYEKLKKVTQEYQEEKEKEAIIEKWLENLKSISNLIEKVDKKSITINDTKIIFSKIKNKINTRELNDLPAEYDDLRKQLSLILRSLSVSIYNTFEDAVFATEVIKLAQLIRADNEIYNNLADAYNQLQKIIEKEKQREESLKFSTDIRGDIVIINADKVTYKNKTLVTKEIDKIKYGIYVYTVNGISSSYYTIWYGDKRGNVIEIECNRFLNSTSTVESQYKQILDATYKIIIPFIFQNIESYFSNGKSITIGNITVNKEGFSYTIGSFFWKEDNFIKWQDVSFSSYQGSLNILNKKNNKLIETCSFRDTWNAVILGIIKEYIIGIKG